MSSSRSNSEISPLLVSSTTSTHSLSREAARWINQVSALPEPSVQVRESIADQVEESQINWAYSKPVVILDLILDLAFIIASVVVLCLSVGEKPEFPLRVWILGYGLRIAVRMACVYAEFKRRRRNNSNTISSSNDLDGETRNYSSSSEENNIINNEIGGDNVVGNSGSSEYENATTTSAAKHLESANTMFSFIWWILGFYWISAGGQTLPSESPQLYWLCVTFLAFDVFFVVICVAVACVIGIMVCCCLPCIIAILYALADQEGATKEVIERLPRFKFQKFGDVDKQSGEIQESFGGVMVECDTDSPCKHVLPLEDAECCICLCAYDDGEELRELPCRHHFHTTCIDKWLQINSICPLCKFNILKNGNQSGSEEA